MTTTRRKPDGTKGTLDLGDHHYDLVVVEDGLQASEGTYSHVWDYDYLVNAYPGIKWEDKPDYNCVTCGHVWGDHTFADDEASTRCFYTDCKCEAYEVSL